MNLSEFENDVKYSKAKGHTVFSIPHDDALKMLAVIKIAKEIDDQGPCNCGCMADFYTLGEALLKLEKT